MGISDYFTNTSCGFFNRMGDQRNFPKFNNNNTNKTQFWHARKFRDSTSVMKGGMCEDIHSGYFAGAFMGRKFKNPATKEFEKSLEYLLDDLSSTSTSITSSMGSSCTSLDTIIDRATSTPESSASTRDGFMIDVTISDNNGTKHKRRPRSDIFDFIQGSDTGHSSHNMPMSKTQSLMDVSQRRQNHKPSTSAKEYEKEFENMLDELHSTLTDLDQFSREKIGVSLDSLSSIDSVSSISNSDQVSSFSNTPDTASLENTTSHSPDDDIDLPLGEGFKYTKLEEEEEEEAEKEEEQEEVCHKNEVIAHIKPNFMDHLEKHVQSTNMKSNFQDQSKKNFWGVHLKSNFKDHSGKEFRNTDMKPHGISTNTESNLLGQTTKDLQGTNIKSKSHEEQIAKDFANKDINFAYKGSCSLGKVLKEMPKHLGMDIKKHSIKQQDSMTDSTPKNTEGESIMSSITDLSIIGSEIGYIADMDDSVFTDTPNFKIPWLDTNVQTAGRGSGMGECFVQQGFRPLKFVGVESKYMITPKKGVELRIPTPMKMRKNISTQTVERKEKSKSVEVKDSASGEETSTLQRELVCTSTQTDNEYHCVCGSTMSLTPDSTKSEDLLKVLWEQSSQKERRVSYNSSVDISPLLNGSQSLEQDTTLPRANSVDSVLVTQKNGQIWSKSGNYTDSQVAKEIICDKSLLTNGNNKNHLEGNVVEKSPKQPQIVITVHSTEPEKQSWNCTSNNECKPTAHNPRNLFVSCQKKINMLKSESAPNISKTYPTSLVDKECDNRLRRYASILIISNISKHLQACCSSSASKRMKRTSYEQDVTLATEKRHSVATCEPYLPKNCGNSDDKQGKKSNRRKKIMTYSF